MKRLKIWWFKRKLRRAYRFANGWRNYMDCGRHIAVHISPSILDHEREYNRVADILCELGEPVPTARFPK